MRRFPAYFEKRDMNRKVKGSLDIDSLVKILLAVVVVAVIAMFVIYGKNMMVTLAKGVYEPSKESMSQAFKKLFSLVGG